jgi:hypothetical protein
MISERSVFKTKFPQNCLLSGEKNVIFTDFFLMKICSPYLKFSDQSFEIY